MSEIVEPAVEPEVSDVDVRTGGHRAWRRFRRHKLAVVSSCILAVLFVMVVFAPWIAPFHPHDINIESGIFKPPSAQHWLGTDSVARDILSRLIHGGRISILVGVTAISISLVIGTVIGGMSGYYGGVVDSVLMRITDVFLSLPTLIIVLASVALLGPSIRNLILIIGFLGWATIARLVRGQFLSLREKEYVMAAHCIGAADIRIMIRHLLPNLVGPLTVAATFGVAEAILLEAALSYLGLGVQVPTPSWGNMLEGAKTVSVLKNMPWIWIPPGFMIAITVLSINIMGDGLRDALDPRSTH
ncbi:MAG: ABC transporter permease [Paracoccaceae bacterium]|nr:ABC transporter permease [Paracoccaceae bacterium]MDE2913022.1 ABC transporter permease [Paracoccaceae bacterium]